MHTETKYTISDIKEGHYHQQQQQQQQKAQKCLLMPIAPGGAQAINDPSPAHSVLSCSGQSRPVGPLLFQLCFSVSPPTVTRPASLSLRLRVPGQGLACDAGCWLPEGVSDPAPRLSAVSAWPLVPVPLAPTDLHFGSSLAITTESRDVV